ncbi:DoxX family protein [Marinomonas spartinae]|uniref:DoxX family protein n=1 Tax=Marinomonas spartinae TaxID=1792290 RepID=UPI0018F25162|nr:DoxX family protein [Marinomonas spartinae]MBJ7553755.1 DoxX family protein [Marinomonas spartinae]
MVRFILSRSESLFHLIPESVILFIARFGIAAVFWKSGQTKIEGFSLDIISRHMHLGWPHLSDTAIYLFENDYKLPLLTPVVAAVMAALAEHILSTLILFGLFTRLAAFGLAFMTLVIEIFVYPDAYPTHATWLAITLLLMVKGAGKLSLDHWINKG